MEIDIKSLDCYTEADADEEQLLAELVNWLPQPGDQLFVHSPAAVPVDCLGSGAPHSPREAVGRFFLYTDSYLEAGDRLVKSCDGSPADVTMLYPIIFLYRHHLELALKGVIYSCPLNLSPLMPEELEKKKAQLVEKHSMLQLWQILKSVDPRCDDWADAPDGFERLIAEFDGHDPNGQAARYSEDKEGNQTLLKLHAVDLQVLKTGVHKMSHYLGAILEDMYQRDQWDSEVKSW